MPTGRSGVKKILEGVLQANKGLPPKEAIGRLVPRHVIINCVDPRVAPSRYAQLNVSEMFLIRNAGNLVPHSSFVTPQSAATEPAVLELAFTKFNQYQTNQYQTNQYQNDIF
jgi:carbonic anhydrase